MTKAVLIMAGGSGERFWPLFTKEKPKQLLSIFSDKLLITKTYERVLHLVRKQNIFIVTNEIQFNALKECPPDVEDKNIIIEQKEIWMRERKLDDPRITGFGKFLRKTSLDELPQLWNIFIGNMTVVSWRPILNEELARYTDDERALLLKVRPGLTRFWASHGRSDTTYADRMKMELYYVYKRSMWLDIRILWHTVIGVFRHDGAK